MVDPEPLDGELALASHRVAMTKTQFRLGALVIFAAILLNNLTSPDRYSLGKVSSSNVILDRVTGKMWRFGPAGIESKPIPTIETKLGQD
jgi:hypothetical protein